MAGYYTELVIDNQHSDPNYNILSGDSIHAMPPKVTDANTYINHSILAGEILGLDVEDLRWCMEMLSRVGKDLERDLPEGVYDGTPIIKEVAELLLKESQKLFQALERAVDKEGRPEGELGELLKNSASIGTNEDGRLFFRSHHIYVFDLQEKLKLFIDLLSYSLANNLLLRYV